MLDELEDALLARLGALRGPLPRVELRSYGGELSDGDLLAETLRAGHAVLVTVPRATFVRKSNGRFKVSATVRLVLCSRQARGERETRHGTADSIGTYKLWKHCVQLLTGYAPLPEFGVLEPTDFNNLVNGRDQNEFLSVLGQSFTVEGTWSMPPHTDEPRTTAIDLNYYLQPDDGVVDATDRID